MRTRMRTQPPTSDPYVTRQEETMPTATLTIPPDVLEVLDRGLSVGPHFKICGQLDRKLYQETNKVLEALGGRWDRKAAAHVFDGSCGDRITAAVLTGTYDNPKALGWFATPAPLARRLVELADVHEGHWCLEPSAGEGAIAVWLAKAAGWDNVVCVEIDAGRSEKLREVFPGHRVLAGHDFLGGFEPGQLHDRIVMNPPFATPGRPQAAIDHVEHAFERFLAPGGRLVSVLPAGVLFGTQRRVAEFREWVDDAGGTLEALPDGSFSASGTEVRTAVLVVEAEA